MSIETPEELAHLKAAGRVVAQAIQAMRAQVRPGVSTAELDAIGARVFRRPVRGQARSLTTGFPA